MKENLLVKGGVKPSFASGFTSFSFTYFEFSSDSPKYFQQKTCLENAKRPCNSCIPYLSELCPVVPELPVLLLEPKLSADRIVLIQHYGGKYNRLFSPSDHSHEEKMITDNLSFSHLCHNMQIISSNIFPVFPGNSCNIPIISAAQLRDFR